MCGPALCRVRWCVWIGCSQCRQCRHAAFAGASRDLVRTCGALLLNPAVHYKTVPFCSTTSPLPVVLQQPGSREGERLRQIGEYYQRTCLNTMGGGKVGSNGVFSEAGVAWVGMDRHASAMAGQLPVWDASLRAVERALDVEQLRRTAAPQGNGAVLAKRGSENTSERQCCTGQSVSTVQYVVQTPIPIGYSYAGCTSTHHRSASRAGTASTRAGWVSATVLKRVTPPGPTTVD